jgi:formate dehydrogenase subunit delta
MNTEHLVEMANQIGAFFDSQGTHEEAVDGIASHLRRSWEPRMLRAIGAHVEAGGAGLAASAAEAVRRLMATTSPAA